MHRAVFLLGRFQLRMQVRHRYGRRAAAAMKELNRVTGSVVADRSRVQRAILQLTDNSFDNLRRWVNVAIADHRDVLGPAEAPTANTAAHVRNFNRWKLDPGAMTETSFAGVEADRGSPR